MVAPDANLVEFVANPEDPVTTDICRGGPELTTAFITSSATGRLLRTTWPHPGLRLPHSQV